MHYNAGISKSPQTTKLTVIEAEKSDRNGAQVTRCPPLHPIDPCLSACACIFHLQSQIVIHI